MFSHKYTYFSFITEYRCVNGCARIVVTITSHPQKRVMATSIHMQDEMHERSRRRFHAAPLR